MVFSDGIFGTLFGGFWRYVAFYVVSGFLFRFFLGAMLLRLWINREFGDASVTNVFSIHRGKGSDFDVVVTCICLRTLEKDSNSV